MDDKDLFIGTIKSIFTKERIFNINKFIKSNLWLTPFAYILGTIALFVRNMLCGLPFSPLSLLHFAIIVIYLIVFLLMYSFAEYEIVAFIDTVLSKKKHKILFILLYFIFFGLIYFGYYIALYFFFGVSSLSKQVVYFFFMLWPLFAILMDNSIVTKIFTLFIFIILIMNIPMSVGGFKRQEVIYHSYDNNIESSYYYYGNYDNLYQFQEGKKIILIPIDSGYIEYEKNTEGFSEYLDNLFS